MPHPKEFVLLALLALMESLAVFVVVVAAGLDGVTPLGAAIFWLILLAGLAGAAVELMVAIIHLGGSPERLALAGTGVVVAGGGALLAARSLLSAAVLAILLGIVYWRGTVISREPPEYEDVQRRFAFGLGLVLLGMVLAVARSLSAAVWPLLTIAGIAYVVVALAALSTGRLEAHRQRGTAPSVFLAVGVQLGILLLLSLVAIALSSQQIGLALDGILGAVWNVIANGLALVAAVLASPLFWLLGHIHPHALHLHPPRRPRTKPAHHHPSLYHGHVGGHAGVSAVILVVGILIVVGLILLLVTALPRREREENEEDVTEERGRLLSPGDAWRLFLGWLAGLFHRGVTAAGQGVGRARRRVLGPSYPSDPVRRIYAQLLHRAAIYGLPRPGNATPQEFLRHLEGRWPEGSAEFAAITRSYVVRRYAEREADPAEVQEVRDRWGRVRRIMRPPEPAA